MIELKQNEIFCIHQIGTFVWYNSTSLQKTKLSIYRIYVDIKLTMIIIIPRQTKEYYYIAF